MTEISLIAALDEANGIGKANQLLCHLPADLQYFKRVTLGKPIVMGRKTYESIGRPLAGRHNLVLSRSPIKAEGIQVYDSLDNLLKSLEYSSELMIIGGAQLYRQTIDLAKRLYITRIHHFFQSDVYFPEICLEQWGCASEVFKARDEKNAYDMTFLTYIKK